MPKFVQLNNDTAVNLDAIGRIERLSGRTLVTIGDITIVAEIPYETMLGLLNMNSQAEHELEDVSIREGLAGLLTNFGQPKP